MKKIKIASTMMVALLLLGTQSCKKDWLDINDDPNNPVTVDLKVVLPSAELAIGHAVGNNLEVFGSIWGQYWTQSPAASQYKTLEQYNPSASDFDRPWRILYTDALTDLRYIQKTAAEQGLTQSVAIAKLLEAYAFQLLTDNFGDVPYTQALQGEAGVNSPAYDSQQSIYNGIIQTALEGVALCDENDPVHPGAEDLIYGGNMLEWKHFGNTLLLRMYLRLSEIDPGTAQAGIAALEAANAEFLEDGESAMIQYTSNGGNTHPYYSVIVEIGGTQNPVASNTSMSYLQTNNDPRVDIFYTPPQSTGVQAGIAQGDYNLPASTPVSVPGPYTGANALDDASASAAVYLMTDYESYFLQAEATARGWLTASGSADVLYYDGIAASFASTGFSNGEDTAYSNQAAIQYPTGGTTADQIKRIITEKWVAMNGTQGDEAWIEWRRTGYPDFFTTSVNSLIGPGQFPVRLFYPATEATRNTNYPGLKAINNKVWWDVN